MFVTWALEPPSVGVYPCSDPAAGRRETSEADVKRTMLVVLMAAVFAVGTVMPAGAHVKKIGSNVKISVSDKTPKKGRHVTFTGKVTSKNHKCEASRKVVLLRNGKVVASKMTNGKGKAKFDQRIKKKADWQIRAKKKAINLAHPHRHVCTKERSKEIRVKPH
jgi:hypothetical protein